MRDEGITLDLFFRSIDNEGMDGLEELQAVRTESLRWKACRGVEV